MKTLKCVFVLLAFVGLSLVGCSVEQQSPVTPTDQGSLEKVTITNFTFTDAPIGFTGEGEIKLVGGNWIIKDYGVIENFSSPDPLVSGTMVHYLSLTIDVVTDPGRLAGAYAAGGARAVSVLTETNFFRGSPEDLKQARSSSGLPVLRKDFIFCDYQLFESAAMGADAVLLIVRILDRKRLADLIQLASDLGLSALVEIYTEADLEDAARAGTRLIGINNRNLKSFETDLGHTLKLLPRLQPEQVAVAASGIKSREDIQRYQSNGVFNFLIGESLVLSKKPTAFLKELRGVNVDA